MAGLQRRIVDAKDTVAAQLPASTRGTTEACCTSCAAGVKWACYGCGDSVLWCGKMTFFIMALSVVWALTQMAMALLQSRLGLVR